MAQFCQIWLNACWVHFLHLFAFQLTLNPEKLSISNLCGTLANSKIHFLFFLTLLLNQNKYWYSCHSVLNPVWLTVQWCSVHIVECICGPTMMTASPRFIFMKRKALNSGRNNFLRSILFVCLFDLGFRLTYPRICSCPYFKLTLQTPIIFECICGPTMMTASPQFIFMKRKALNNRRKSFWRSLFVCCFDLGFKALHFMKTNLGACCHHCWATHALNNVYTTPLHS